MKKINKKGDNREIKILNKEEKDIYDSFMNNVKFIKLDESVWKKKAPKGFEGW